MRDAVVDRELEHFRVDHDQPALLRPQPVEQTQDHGVDGDRFAGAGGAGDQQVRHAREIDDHGLAADGLAEAERQFRAAVDIVAAGELLAQIDLLACGVRQLDADDVASCDHGDARGERAHGAGNVVGEPDHARGFDARRGLELVKRDDRARSGIDDLAAHAEVAKHALERGGVRLQRVGAQHGATDRLRRGEEFERGQHIAAARPSWRARRCAWLARRVGACGVLVVRLRSDRWLQRGTCAPIETRLDPAMWRCLAMCRRSRRGAARQRPREPRLEAEKAVGDKAERDRSARVVLFERTLRVAAIGAPSKARGDREGQQHPRAGRERDRDAYRPRERSAGGERRQPQHPVSDHAAEPDRQRPGGAARQRGCAAGGQQHAEYPEQQAHALALHRAVGDEPPAPNRDRQDERERGHAEKLRQQVGDNGAGHAENVAHRRIRGMAERRVLHRPGRERECNERREHDQSKPAKLAQTPPQSIAHGVGEKAQTVEAAVDGCHDVPQPNTATRRWSACAVVSWSCTMATRM